MSDRVVFVDIETMKPGCVLIQAMLGGDRELLYEHFDDTDWEVGLIDNMRPCPERLVEQAAAKRKELRA